MKIIDVVKFMPERVIENEPLLKEMEIKARDLSQAEDELGSHTFFRGVKERRFASPDYSSEELGVKVLEKLLNKTNFPAAKIDLLICTCIFSDTYWPNIATALQQRIGAKDASIINIDTSCASFLTGINVAKAFIESGKYRNIALVSVTNFISRLPEFQKKPPSLVLGDGAIAALLSVGEPSIVSSIERSYGENYGLMKFEPDYLKNGEFRNYWEQSCGPITVHFDHESVAEIRHNALEIVPRAVNACLQEANLSINDINLLITHQPNRQLIEDWRERIGISPDRVHDTLDIYGNLFQGSVAVTLADAIENKIVKDGDLIAIGTFSNGGDFASAMIIRWKYEK